MNPTRGRAADEERELDGWADDALLALAADEERVLVTFDVKDFPDIARRWAEAGRAHAGCAIVVGLDHGELGAILRALDGLIEERPDSAAPGPTAPASSRAASPTEARDWGAAFGRTIDL